MKNYLNKINPLLHKVSECQRKLWTTLLMVSVFVFGFFVFAQNASAATYYAIATGNWNVNTTWSLSSGGGAVGVGIWPVAGDTVYIGEGVARTVTIPTTTTVACTNLYLGQTPDTNKNAGTLTFATSSSVLNVSGNAIIYGPLGNAARTINVNAGTMTVGGNLELGTGQTGAQANRISKVVITTGTITVSGGLTFNNTITSSPAQTQIDMSGGAGTFNLAGTFTISNSLGTLAPGTTSTFNFNGTSAQTIPIGVSSVVYNNLNVNNTNASGANLSAIVTSTNVTGNVSVGNVSSGSLFNTGNFNITFGNSKTMTVASGSTMNAGTSVVTYGATGTATINGIFQTANGAGFSGGAGTTAISSTNTPTISLGGSSTVEYNRNITSGQTVTDRDYNNLTITGSTQTKTWTIGATRTINGNVTINSSAPLTLSGAQIVNVKGDWSNSGTFTSGTGTITLNGVSA